MDYSKYNEQTNALIKKMFHQKKMMDETIFDTLSEIMDVAKGLNDDVLIGFAHYHLADSLYAFEVDYNQFRHHISSAIACLINTKEDELMTRAYNYLGIDAMNNGVFDVAYYHFMNALYTCEPLNNVYLLSIINNNIGQIYARMGNHAKALEHVSLSNKQQLSTSKDDIYYYQNTINGFFSEGILNIFLGNIDRAKEIEKDICILEEESGIPDLANVVIPVSFLRLQIALLDNDTERIQMHCAETMRVINDAHRLYDFITDIRDLCMFLINHEFFEIVRAILDAITQSISNAKITRMKQHLYAIEIAYNEKLGQQDELVKLLLQQHHTDLEQEEEQNRIRMTSMELIDTMNELRKQREQLEIQASTDALTGIPNRLAMENSLNESFEKAFKNASRFAIEILDVDCFKDYNDFYGHQAGDVCLQKIAGAISNLAKEEGFFHSRYGGDEFVLIFENQRDEDILRIANKLSQNIHDLNLVHEKAKRSDRISISQGICNDIPKDKNKPWDFFSKADGALYAAKNDYHAALDHTPIRLVNLTKE